MRSPLSSGIVKRSVQRARQAGVSRLLRRLHRVTHRAQVEVVQPDGASLVVVAPHMDDEVIGPGGTVALHKKAGSHVVVVFCAAGADPEIDAIRRSEAEASCELLGIDEVRFLGYPDGALSPQEKKLGTELSGLLKTTRPARILCPFPADHHRDHTAAAMATALAIKRARWTGQVWCYEVWSPLWPNTAVDITSVVDLKREAIGKHASQTAGLHYADGILGLNRYRGLKAEREWAEAFYVCDEVGFAALTDQMNQL